jgi:type I restriction enzyme S subunit
VEAKSATNVRIAACATELSDAQFATEILESRPWPERPFGELVELFAGAMPRPQSDQAGMPSEDGISFVAPADILQSDLPYLRRTEQRLALGEEGSAWGPDCLLAASKDGEVRAVMSREMVAAGRGVLVLRPESAADAHWLLHEIRSRGAELAGSARGSAGRELSRRAFGTAPVRWPPHEVRERFARLTERLHMRARTAHAENEVLLVLQDRLLDSFLTGTFLRPDA